MKWAENKGDAITGFEEATLQIPQVTEVELRELYVYLLHYLIGEPRIIAKGSNGNGAEAWRRSKARYDPMSETSQVNVLLQVLQPSRAKNIKDILPCIEKWEEGLRRQETITGVEPLTDGTKRALLIKMCTGEAPPVECAPPRQLRKDAVGGGELHTAQPPERPHRNAH